MERFSTASAVARVDGVLDAASFQPLVRDAGAAALLAGEGRLGGEPVWVVATDPRSARGALGVREAELLCALFEIARREMRPLLLLIDSAGAKVGEGLAALGAFRRLFRQALLTRLAGVPMLALLGRSCFGGASMLACVCTARVYSAETLLAVSGPGVIQALGGKDELDVADGEQVRALMGGATRTRLGSEEALAADGVSAFRDCALQLLRDRVRWVACADWGAQHAVLGARLSQGDASAGQPLADGDSSIRLDGLLPAGYVPALRSGVYVATPPPGADGPAFVGLLGGSAVGAGACWQLSDVLLELHRSALGKRIVLLLDAVGHAATRRDETLMLSAYLVHLSLVAASLGQHGHSLSLCIPGSAAGAVYVAFAAPVERVSALPTARIRILPEAAVRQILRAQEPPASDPEALVRTGVIDAFLDPRPDHYAAARAG